MSNLRKHERLHEGRKPYSCHIDQCECAFVKKTQLYTHLKREHKVDTPFTCDICSSNFTTQAHLSRHKQRVHFSTFMCTDCFQIFDKFSALNKHISKVHKKRAYCAHCNISFTNQSNLNIHVGRVHLTPDSGMASSSSQSPSSKSSVEFKTQLVTLQHLLDQDSSPYFSGPFSTELQDNIFADKTEQEDNLEDKSISKNTLLEHCAAPKTREMCSSCNSVFRSKSLLTRHLKSVHNIIHMTQYKCAECSAVFKHKPNLMTHTLSKHQGVKRFTCSHCPKQFYYKHAHQRHVQAKHSGQERAPREPWNKISELEDVSGHIVDEQVRDYVGKMSELGSQSKDSGGKIL